MRQYVLWVVISIWVHISIFGRSMAIRKKSNSQIFIKPWFDFQNTFGNPENIKKCFIGIWKLIFPPFQRKDFVLGCKFKWFMLQLITQQIPTRKFNQTLSISLRLFCSSPLPRVFWNQEDLKKLGGKFGFTNNNAMLVINEISERIAGPYNCRGESTGSYPATEWATIEVTVHRPPTTEMLHFVAKAVGDSLELRCHAEGSPRPFVQFLVNGEKSECILNLTAFQILPC